MQEGRETAAWLNKIAKIDNPELQQFITKYVELCNPDKVFVCTDSDEDIEYIKESSIKNGGQCNFTMLSVASL